MCLCKKKNIQHTHKIYIYHSRTYTCAFSLSQSATPTRKRAWMGSSHLPGKNILIHPHCHGERHDEGSSGLPSNLAAEKRNDQAVIISGLAGRFRSRCQKGAVSRESQARRSVRHGHRSEDGCIVLQQYTPGEG